MQQVVMWWTLGGILASVLVFGGLAWLILHNSARPYTAERRLATELAATGQAAEATVVGLERKTGGNIFAAHHALSVRYTDGAGDQRDAVLHAAIDKDLAANFVPGKTVHVRYDPADPMRIAIDRSKTPTFVPAAWRSDT